MPIENPTYSRIAQISVEVDHRWLTQDGELQLAESWEEITRTLTRQLDRAVPWPEVRIKFEGWETEPVVWYSATIKKARHDGK